MTKFFKANRAVVERLMLDKNISTLRALADRAFITRRSLYNAFKEPGVSRLTITRLANALGVEATVLLAENSDT